MLHLTQLILQQAGVTLLSSKLNVWTEELLRFEVTSALLKLDELEAESSPALVDSFVKMVLLKLYLFRFIDIDDDADDDTCSSNSNNNNNHSVSNIFTIDWIYLISRFAASSHPTASRCINIFGFSPQWFQTIYHKVYANDAVKFYNKINLYQLNDLKYFLCMFIDFYKSIVRIDEVERQKKLNSITNTFSFDKRQQKELVATEEEEEEEEQEASHLRTISHKHRKNDDSSSSSSSSSSNSSSSDDDNDYSNAKEKLSIRVPKKKSILRNPYEEYRDQKIGGKKKRVRWNLIEKTNENQLNQ